MTPRWHTSLTPLYQDATDQCDQIYHSIYPQRCYIYSPSIKYYYGVKWFSITSCTVKKFADNLIITFKGFYYSRGVYWCTPFAVLIIYDTSSESVSGFQLKSMTNTCSARILICGLRGRKWVILLFFIACVGKSEYRWPKIVCLINNGISFHCHNPF